MNGCSWPEGTAGCCGAVLRGTADIQCHLNPVINGKTASQALGPEHLSVWGLTHTHTRTHTHTTQHTSHTHPHTHTLSISHNTSTSVTEAEDSISFIGHSVFVLDMHLVTTISNPI